MPFDTTDTSPNAKFHTGVNIGWLIPQNIYSNTPPNNLPSSSYGCDLGPYFDNAWGPEPKYDAAGESFYKKLIEAYFTHLKSNKTKVARMWLFEGFEGLQLTNNSLPQVFYLSKRWFSDFSIPETATFEYINKSKLLDRVSFVMEQASKNELQIYWTLFDAAFLLDKKQTWYGLVYNHLIINTVNKNDKFLTDILEPFLDKILNKLSNVFAIDIVNEIDWSWNTPKDPERKKMVEFTKKIHDFIKQKSSNRIPCTASFAKFSELFKKYFRNLKKNELEPDVSKRFQTDFDFLDFYDYHRYYNSKKPNHPDFSKTLETWPATGKRCIIGEVGNLHKIPNEAEDLKEMESTFSTLMQQTKDKGYSGILFWRYSPIDSESKNMLVLNAQSNPNQTSYIQFVNMINAFITGSNPLVAYERGTLWEVISLFINYTIPPNRQP